MTRDYSKYPRDLVRMVGHRLRAGRSLHYRNLPALFGVLFGLLAACAFPAWAEGESSLVDAAFRGDVASIRAALERGADVNMRGAKGETPLMVAAMMGRTEAVGVLLDSGADIDLTGTPNFRFGWNDLKDKLGDCYSAVTLAAAAGRHGAVELLLARGADTKCARTGLLSLAIAGRAQETDEQVALVSWLMSREAVTPFDRSLAYFNHHPRIQALLGANALDLSDRQVAVEYSVWGMTLGWGYDALFRDFGDADIWQAAVSGDLDRIEGLLAAGVSVNARDDEAGATPLMSAVLGAIAATATSTVEMLVARGADVNAADRRGVTALMLAAGNTSAGSGAVVSALLEAGAQRDIKSADGRDAMEFAKRSKNLEAITILRAVR